MKYAYIIPHLCGIVSLPVRGAWIEIFLHADSNPVDSVAPRAGSVD